MHALVNKGYAIKNVCKRCVEDTIILARSIGALYNCNSIILYIGCNVSTRSLLLLCHFSQMIDSLKYQFF